MSKLEFKAEVKKALTLKGWTYKRLAEETGYTYKSVQQMMYDENKLSSKAMTKFAEVLGIEH